VNDNVKVKATLAIISLTPLALFVGKLAALRGFQHGH
jgi:hypothetical protein